MNIVSFRQACMTPVRCRPPNNVVEHLKYLVFAQDRPIACLAWSSAPRHLGPRDRFIGWSTEARRRNLRFLAYISWFLILPWINVPNLVSHLLGTLAKQLLADRGIGGYAALPKGHGRRCRRRSCQNQDECQR